MSTEIMEAGDEVSPVQNLYRHYDADGVLLYVGVSLSAIVRLAQHRSASHWFSEIARIEIKQYPTRESVLLAERKAIFEENPRHNLMRPTSAEVKREEKRMSRSEASREHLLKRVTQFNPVYSIHEVSEVTGMAHSKIKALISDGSLGSIKVGATNSPNGVKSRLKVTGWQLIDFIENLEAGTLKV